MNSFTLRRLAADHASLHNAELPPHYLFPSSDVNSTISDNLTQLTILLAGPQGTPYSQGLWKLCLKIPEDYPKSPPKASFRTRIWHPNVEENSGSVCVDTLKKDWESKLTLRDVLITISCLLINPNPDSALNATAGHLLQEDYASFARQAKLMTSIHAGIPSSLKEAASAARRRGEDSGITLREDAEFRPTLKGKTAGPLSVIVKKKLPQRITSTLFAPAPGHTILCTEESEGEGDENSASKENDPMLSPQPVPAQCPRRPTLPKRPLSDLPCPVETEGVNADASCLSPSEQIIVNNVPHQLAQIDNDARPAKRVCSDESKENASAGQDQEKLGAKPASLLSKTEGNATANTVRKGSASGALGNGTVKAGKPRVGLRRL